MLTPTDISLIFLGILIVMVLLEVRKLSGRPAPAKHLEEQVERLSRQMEQIRPAEMVLPGGARLVEAEQRFETVSEQLERLGESAAEIDPAGLDDEVVRRFAAAVGKLQTDVSVARSLFEEAARGLGEASDSVRAAGSALQRVEAQLDQVVEPKPRPMKGGAEGAAS